MSVGLITRLVWWIEPKIEKQNDQKAVEGIEQREVGGPFFTDFAVGQQGEHLKKLIGGNRGQSVGWEDTRKKVGGKHRDFISAAEKC